jgi:hypothetical protein
MVIKPLIIKNPASLKKATERKFLKMATHISELTWWKARDMEQAETRSIVWTTPFHRYSRRGPIWATATQPTRQVKTRRVGCAWVRMGCSGMLWNAARGPTTSSPFSPNSSHGSSTTLNQGPSQSLRYTFIFFLQASLP